MDTLVDRIWTNEGCVELEIWRRGHDFVIQIRKLVSGQGYETKILGECTITSWRAVRIAGAIQQSADDGPSKVDHEIETSR